MSSLSGVRTPTQQMQKVIRLRKAYQSVRTASIDSLRDYLDAVIKLVVMNPDADICREIDILFQITIYRPARPLRQILERRNIATTMRQQSREQLHSLVSHPLAALFIIGDHLIHGLLNSVDNKRTPATQTTPTAANGACISNHGNNQMNHFRSMLLRLLMYISDCHRYQYNNGRAFDTARLMSLVSPRDPEAHLRLALTGAQLTTSNPVSESQPLQHFFHFCAFLANRSVPLKHPEAAVVHKFVISNTVRNGQSSEQALLNGEGNDDECDFIPLFIDVIWSSLRLSRGAEATKSDIRQSRLWKSFSLALDLPGPDHEAGGNNKHRILSQRECEIVVAVLMFTADRVRNGTHFVQVNHKAKNEESVSQQQTPQGNEKSESHSKKQPEREGDVDVVDELICRTILSLAGSCQQGLQRLVEIGRKKRKRRRRSMQKQRQRRSVKQQQEQQEPRSNNNVNMEETINADILNSVVDPDAQAPGLGALALLGVFWTGYRLGSVSELQDLLSSTLLRMRSLIKTIDDVFHVSRTDNFAQSVLEKFNHQPCNQTPILPALPEDVVVQHFAPCDNVAELRRVVKHDVGFVSLLKGVMKKSNVSETPLKGDLLRECIEEFGKKTHQDVIGQTSRKHLEAFSVQCSKEIGLWSDKSLTSISAVERSSICKVVALLIRKARLCKLVAHLEKVNGGTLLNCVQQREREKQHHPEQMKEENRLQQPKPTHGGLERDTEATERAQPQPQVREQVKHPQNSNCVPGSKKKDRNDEQISGKRKIGQLEDEDLNELNSLLEESELELRVAKRRRVQGGCKIAGSASPIAGGSHESHKRAGVVPPLPPPLPSHVPPPTYPRPQLRQNLHNQISSPRPSINPAAAPRLPVETVLPKPSAEKAPSKNARLEDQDRPERVGSTENVEEGNQVNDDHICTCKRSKPQPVQLPPGRSLASPDDAQVEQVEFMEDGEAVHEPDVQAASKQKEVRVEARNEEPGQGEVESDGMNIERIDDRLQHPTKRDEGQSEDEHHKPLSSLLMTWLRNSTARVSPPPSIKSRAFWKRPLSEPSSSDDD